jgi:hypothetical protein
VTPLAEDDIIKELEELRSASSSSSDIDSIVDEKVKRYMRDTQLKGLYSILSKLQQKVALHSVHVYGKPLVRSHLSREKPNGMVQEVETRTRAINAVLLYKSMDPVDGRYDRILIFDEFTRRFDVLVDHIEKGNGDDLIGYHPESLIHAIMGQSGELLNRLGIDPRRGATYAMLDKEIKPPKTTLQQPDLTPAFYEIAEVIRNRNERANSTIMQPIPTVKPVKITYDLGFVVEPLDNHINEQRGLSKGTRGLLVTTVFGYSRAEEAGLIVGDIIQKVDGNPVEKSEELRDYLDHYHIQGSELTFAILREGKNAEIKIIF